MSKLAFFAVTGQFDNVAEGEEIVFAGYFVEHFFEFRINEVDACATVLTGGVVMVRREDLTELNLTFEAMPDAIDDAQPLEKCDSAVGRGAVNGWGTGLGEFGRRGRARFE